MATLKLRRNLILSLKDHIEADLISEGFTAPNDEFTFVSSWSEDDKIVKPADYVPGSDMIKLPAGNISVLNRRGGEKLEIGGTGEYTYVILNIFIHAVTEGQLTDLLDIIHESISDNNASLGGQRIVIKDFSSTGYPSDSATELYIMEMSEVTSRPVRTIDSPNLALKFAGSVTGTGKLLRSL